MPPLCKVVASVHLLILKCVGMHQPSPDCILNCMPRVCRLNDGLLPSMLLKSRFLVSFCSSRLCWFNLFVGCCTLPQLIGVYMKTAVGTNYLVLMPCFFCRAATNASFALARAGVNFGDWLKVTPSIPSITKRSYFSLFVGFAMVFPLCWFMYVIL